MFGFLNRSIMRQLVFTISIAALLITTAYFMLSKLQ